MSSLASKINAIIPTIHWEIPSAVENPVVEKVISDIAEDVIRHIAATKMTLQLFFLPFTACTLIVRSTLLKLSDSPDFDNLTPQKMRLISQVYQKVLSTLDKENVQKLKFATFAFAIDAITRFNPPVTPEFTAYVLEKQKKIPSLKDEAKTDEAKIDAARIELTVLLFRPLIHCIELEKKIIADIQKLKDDSKIPPDAFVEDVKRGLGRIKMYQEEETARLNNL